jgi:Protein of unknown function (DUF2934)
VYDPKASKQPQLKTVASPQGSPSPVIAISEPVPSEDQIRQRAYQLYENGGRQDGQAQDDWLAAEQILNRRW